MSDSASDKSTVLDRIIGYLDHMNRTIAKACIFTACGFAVLIAAVVFGGVVMRYLFNMPLQWQEEIPKFLMVWMTFVGAVPVYRQNDHIVLRMLPNALTGRGRAVLQLCIALICMIVLIMFLKYGITAAENAKGQRIILLESLSLFWVYLAIPLGSGLMLLAVAQDALTYARQIAIGAFEEMPE